MFWECKMVQSLWKIVWWFLKKSKTRIIIWFSSPLFWHVCMLSASVMSDSLQPHGLSLGFSRQEHWSGLPFPPRDLPYPGIERAFPVAPALADEFFFFFFFNCLSHLGGPTLLVLYPKELKAGHWRDICISVSIATLFIIAKRWKKSTCSSVD